MTKNDFFQQVRDLNLPLGKYAIFGSAPMVVRGLKEYRDIDMVVSEDIWEELSKKGWPIKYSEFGNPFLCYKEMEIGKDFWQPGVWNMRELINEADVIEGLPFVKLERVLEYKKMLGREKDLEDVKKIENFLQAQNLINK